MASAAATDSSRRSWAGYLLGFALGGFFDGILLHQILQWHHLLLGIQTGPFRQMRTQILADGLFHLVMYAIALAGLWSLWRSRHAAQFAGRELLGDALIGFGIWHVLDTFLSHWILGIHRIKMDSPNPLMWDVLWLIAFGIVPLLAGFMMRKRAGVGGPRSGGRRAAAAMLVALVLIAGPIAALAPPQARQVAVLVAPAKASELLDGVRAINGGIMWADRSGSLWVFTVDEGARPERLYEHGALLITRSPAALGCLAWTRNVGG